MRVFLLLICMLPTLLTAQTTNVELQQAITDLSNDAFMKQGRWGLSVTNASTGINIAAVNSDSLFIPASIIKMLTAATVFDMVGDTFHYRTNIYYSGSIDANGILHGDLWIQGSGDPTIGSDFFGAGSFVDSIAAALTRLKIQGIDGHLIGLANVFDSIIIPDTYPVEDYGNYYGAGTSALIWDGNRMMLEFSTPANKGAATKLLSFFPPFDGFTLENNTTSGVSGTGDNSIVFGEPFNVTRSIEGTLPPGKNSFKVYASSPNPALGFVIAVKHHLEKKGIFCKGEPLAFYHGRIPDQASLLKQYVSPDMKAIASFTLTNSHNVTAETLLKTTGMIQYGTGTYANGLHRIHAFLNTLSIDTNRLVLHDGSGLSKANKVSPSLMTDFLVNIRNQSWFSTFENAMPLAAKTGTLSQMFTGTSVAGKLRAKSGYMKTVRSYAGYVPNQQGEIMVFCIMVNHYGGNAYALRKKLENLMIAISFSH